MRPWLLIAMLASAAWLASTSGSGAQTLQDAMVAAYLTNPDLAAQRAALRATDELVPEALSGWRPTLAITGTVNDTHATTRSGGSTGGSSFQEKGSSLVLSQELYSGGETVANTRRAEQLVRAQRAQLAVTEQNVLLDAVTAYTNMLAAQAVLNFSIQNESRLKRQLQATRDRFQVGEVTRTDVAQAEARLSGAVADRVLAEGGVSTARAEYRRVINQEPGKLVVPPPLKGLPAGLAEAQRLAEVDNPNIALAQFNLAAARSDVDVAMSALYPRLSIQGELNYTDEPNASLDWERSASIGANLRVPLYQGGGEYARVRQTKQTVRQREEDLDSAFRSVRNEVTSAWQTLETATSRIDSIGAQVHANEIAVEGARQEALVGQRTTLDVLDQESDLFQSQVNLVQARRDQVIASYRVKASVGELTVARIGLPVQPYNPQAYYADVRNRLIGLGTKSDPGTPSKTSK